MNHYSMLIILSVCNYSCSAQLSVLFSPRSDRHIVEEQVLNSLRITDVKLGITNPMCLDTIWGFFIYCSRVNLLVKEIS